MRDWLQGIDLRVRSRFESKCYHTNTFSYVEKILFSPVRLPARPKFGLARRPVIEIEHKNLPYAARELCDWFSVSSPCNLKHTIQISGRYIREYLTLHASGAMSSYSAHGQHSLYIRPKEELRPCEHLDFHYVMMRISIPPSLWALDFQSSKKSSREQKGK